MDQINENNSYTYWNLISTIGKEKNGIMKKKNVFNQLHGTPTDDKIKNLKINKIFYYRYIVNLTMKIP